MAERKKFIIDTDAGIDDAQAILMALNSPEVDVVAITTCHGNTNADQVCRNVLRLLKVAGRMDIPVYQGCNLSMTGDEKNATHYHGLDGFGDVPDPEAPDLTHAQSEHAVNALVRMTNENPGVYTLIALAPLTNIALAHRMSPGFSKNLKACYIMGGNYEGKGNVTPAAEFNFYADPESAHVVLGEIGCPTYLVCWELCLKHALSWEWHQDFVSPDNERSNFLRKIEAQTVKRFYQGVSIYITCDQVAMACAIAPEAVITETQTMTCQVVTGAGIARGAMIADSSARMGPPEDDGRKPNPVVIVKGINQEIYQQQLSRATK